jgi:tRNA threonylcarbamoyladenosine biosynthesis protein TsaE
MTDSPFIVTARTRGSDATRALGRALGRAAQPGDGFLLTGSFGAGKTVLVQGLAEGLGVADDVVSPSFVLMVRHDGPVPLVHADLYRLGGSVDAEVLAELEEALDGSEVVAIEWPEALAATTFAGASRIDIEIVDETTRDLRLSTSRRALADAFLPVDAAAPA